MAVNFCHSHHSPSIRCNKVSMDGFEVENLISSEFACRRKGFLAASFISPPVEIIITFPHLIDVNYIVLGLTNCSQRTSVVRLYSTCQDPRETLSRNFQHIGTFENISESKLTLVNKRYRPLRLFQTLRHFKPISDVKELSPKFDSSVSQVKALKICIIKTARSTVPVLSELQVWGQPGRDCSPELKKRIFDIEQGKYLKSHIASMEGQNWLDEESENDVLLDNGKDIPSEFLDPITFEPMSEPMLLPSGNHVDRSTLEKYLDSSAKWGRLPGDPFTSVPFGPLSQPSFNVQLKQRIENFWLSKPHLCSVAKHADVVNNPHLRYDYENSLVESCIKQSELVDNNFYDFQKPKHDLYSKTENDNFSLSSEVTPPYKKFKSSGGIQGHRFMSNEQKSERLPRGHLLKRSAPAISVTAKALKNTNATYCSSALSNYEHQKQLSSSLNCGLKKVLSDKPSYIRSCEDSKTSSKYCSICRCQYLHGAYRLPCSHTLCRSCLIRETTSAQPSCKTCNVSYLSCEVVRFYE